MSLTDAQLWAIDWYVAGTSTALRRNHAALRFAVPADYAADRAGRGAPAPPTDPSQRSRTRAILARRDPALLAVWT